MRKEETFCGYRNDYIAQNLWNERKPFKSICSSWQMLCSFYWHPAVKPLNHAKPRQCLSHWWHWVGWWWWAVLPSGYHYFFHLFLGDEEDLLLFSKHCDCARTWKLILATARCDDSSAAVAYVLWLQTQRMNRKWFKGQCVKWAVMAQRFRWSAFKNTTIYCVDCDVACEVQHKWGFMNFAGTEVHLPFKMLYIKY